MDLADLQRMVPSSIEVSAAGAPATRTLAARFADVVDVADFGSDGSSMLSAATSALAAGKSVRVTTQIAIASNHTFPDVHIEFKGGAIVGTGTITFEGEVSSAKRMIFGSGVTVRLTSHRQHLVFPEWWGAVPMLEPRDLTLGGPRGVVDSTVAIQRSIDSFSGYAYSGAQYGARIHLSGWYATTDEIRIVDKCVQLQGSSATYGGSGLRCVSDPSSTLATKAILHLSGAGNSEVNNIGFMCRKSTDPATRMLAAVRTSFGVLSGTTQRHIKLKGLFIGDYIGFFDEQDPGLYYQAGILSGGPGSSNGNDDFHVIDDLQIGFCDRGIKVTQSMAVEWQIRQYVTSGCRVMYESTNGGSMHGYGWYAARDTVEGVVRAYQAGSGCAFTFTLDGFSTEHLQAQYFVGANMPCFADINAQFLEFSAEDLQSAAVSQAGTAITSTDEFFFDTMVGMRLNWAGSSTVITAVADSRHATGNTSQTVAASAATATNTLGEREPKVFTGFSASTNQFCVTLINQNGMSIDTTFGTPNPLTRLTIDPAPAVTPIQHYFRFLNPALGIFGAYLKGLAGGNNGRIVDIEVSSPHTATGSFQCYPSCRKRFVSNEGADANGYIPLLSMQTQSVHDLTVDTIALGQKRGSVPALISAPTFRLVAPSSASQLSSAGFFKAGRVYLGVCVIPIDTNGQGTTPNYFVTAGVPGDPERFGRVAGAYMNWSSNGLNGRAANFAADTDLVLRCALDSGATTITQSGTNISASAGVFNASMVGQIVTMLDGAQAGQTITVQAYTDTTTMVAADSKTVAAGRAYVSFPITSGSRFLVQPFYFEIPVSAAVISYDHLGYLPALPVAGATADGVIAHGTPDISYGTAAPAGGGKQGDVRYNALPVAGGPLGWVCVAGGSWKTFGAISA